jgi:PsbP
MTQVQLLALGLCIIYFRDTSTHDHDILLTHQVSALCALSIVALLFIPLLATPGNGAQLRILPNDEQSQSVPVDSNTIVSTNGSNSSNPTSTLASISTTSLTPTSPISPSPALNQTSSATITAPSTPSSTAGSFQSSPEDTQGPPIGLVTFGTINSLITTPATRWIATGNWSMDLVNGTVKDFGANMTWYNSSGTTAHSHEFLNFTSDKGRVISSQKPSNNVYIHGVMDVGTNSRVVWHAVPTTIEINGKKTITIAVDDQSTNHHFASQPILGVVNSFVLCSDIPGTNMEVLPPCTPVVPVSVSNTSVPVVSNVSDISVINDNSTNISSTSSSSNASAGSVFSIYENATSGVKISYPPDWTVEQQGRAVSPSLQIALKFLPSSDPDSHFTLGIRKLSKSEASKGIEVYATNAINDYKAKINNFQSITFNTKGQLSSNPGYEIEGTYIDDKSTKRHLFEVGTIVGNKLYILQFDTDDLKASTYLPTLGTMVHSFQIIGELEGSLDKNSVAQGIVSSGSDKSNDNNNNNNNNNGNSHHNNHKKSSDNNKSNSKSSDSNSNNNDGSSSCNDGSGSSSSCNDGSGSSSDESSTDSSSGGGSGSGSDGSSDGSSTDSSGDSSNE